MATLSLSLEFHMDFEHPTIEPERVGVKRLTYGDGHGNTAKLFLNLKRDRLIDMDDASIAEVKQFSEKTMGHKEKRRYLEILNTITLGSVRGARLLGDLNFERGPGNDYLMLGAIVTIKKIGIDLIIQTSNHDERLSHAIEVKQFKIERKDDPLAFQWETGYKLSDMVKDCIVSLQEVQSWYAIYRQCLVCLSCSIKKARHRIPKITIYNHGPGVDLGRIKRLVRQYAAHFPIEKFKNDPTAVMQAIDVINEALAKSPTVSGFMSPKSLPFEMVWIRGYKDLDNEHDIEAYTLKFVHGHDLSQGRRFEHKHQDGRILATYKSLDDTTGKGNFNSGTVFVHASLGSFPQSLGSFSQASVSFSQSQEVKEADAAD